MKIKEKPREFYDLNENVLLSGYFKCPSWSRFYYIEIIKCLFHLSFDIPEIKIHLKVIKCGCYFGVVVGWLSNNDED